MQVNDEWGKAKAALAFVPSDDRDTWLRMGMAIKAEFGDAGRELWEEWSEAADSYNPADAGAVWKSIHEGGGITIASLYHEAKEAGWKPNGYGAPRELTPEEIAQREQRAREAKERDDREAAEAATKSVVLWREAVQAQASHPYLQRKGVAPVATLRVIEASKAAAILGYGPQAGGEPLKGDLLLAPLKCGEQIVSAELIDGAGRKAVIAGSRVRGAYWAAQPMPDREVEGLTLGIGEGVATVLSVKTATGCHAIAARSCGNLRPVAEAMRARYPKARIVILSDLGNGEDKAREAARSVGGFLALPDFGTNRPDGAKDFNDLHKSGGAEAIRKAVEAASAPEVSESQPMPENGSRAVLEGAWPELRPIQSALKPVLAFDPDVLLPEPIRSWVMDEAERMPCVPDFIAAPVLVAIGSIGSTQCAIKPKHRDDWHVTPNLWGGNVGGPSSLKSPALQAAFKPLGRLVAKAIQEHEGAMLAYETKKTVSDAQQEAIEQRIKAAAKDSTKGDVNKIASELLMFRQQEAEGAPALRRYKTNDATVEKLGEILRDNRRGILVERDELVGLLASWDREGREGDRTFFLEAWNGTGSFDTDRISRGSIFIEYLCASLYGGIQPDKLTGYLEQAAHSLGNDGMLQRFQLLVYPDPRKWEWRDRLPLKGARDEAFKVFETLSEFKPEDWGAAPADDFVRFPYFRFDDAAQELFIRWMEELNSRIAQEDSPIIAQHLAKYPKLFPALALIFHLIDCAANGRRGQVTHESALMAAAWCQYLESHARRCYGLLADDGLRAAQMLSEKLRQGRLETGFTARDVRRNQWRYLTTDDAVHAALDWLSDDGWIRPMDGAGAASTGRKTVRYAINPNASATRPGDGEQTP